MKKVEMNYDARCIMTASLDPTGLVPYLFYGGRYRNIEHRRMIRNPHYCCYK